MGRLQRQYDEQKIQQWVHAAQAGDVDAFQNLVRVYYPVVYKFVSHYIHNNVEALDITQEAFLKAYRSLGQFQEKSSFYTWIYRIALNTAKNYLLSQHIEISESDTEKDNYENKSVDRLVLKETDSPEDFLIQQETQLKLDEIFKKMPEELLEVLDLQHAGFSYKVIADLVHCPVGTVRSRIFRARADIEDALKNNKGHRHQ